MTVDAINEARIIDLEQQLKQANARAGTQMSRVPTRVAEPTVMIQQRQEFIEYVRQGLKEGQDFMKIPGIEKSILTKAGAEKLCKYFGLFPRLTLVEKTEAWGGPDAAAYGGGFGFFRYKYRCDMIWPMRLEDGGIQEVVVANCFGEANSKETKWAYRWIEETKLTEPQKKAAEADGFIKDTGKSWVPLFTLSPQDKKRAEGWPNEMRKSRKGSMIKWVQNPDIVMVRVPNEEIFSLVNTIDKMAQKRAFTGATTLATNASDLYTVDLDDSAPPPDRAPEPTEAQEAPSKPKPEVQEAEFSPEPEGEAPPQVPEAIAVDPVRHKLAEEFKSLVTDWTVERIRAESDRCFGEVKAGTKAMDNDELQQFIDFIKRDVAVGHEVKGYADTAKPTDEQTKKILAETERLGLVVVENMAKILFNADSLDNLTRLQMASLLEMLAKEKSATAPESSDDSLPAYDDEGDEIKWMSCAGKDCSSKIRWGKNKKTGNPHPYNPDGSSHFSTCPNAPDFRKEPKKAKKGAKK